MAATTAHRKLDAFPGAPNTEEDLLLVRKSSKGFSVITDFGCAFSCPYCVWKNHPSNRRHSYPTDWDRLETLIAEIGRDKISVSGGGDPLYRLRDHADWWWTLMAICGGLNKQIQVHTHNHKIPWGWARSFDKIVLHVDAGEPLPQSDIRMLARWTELRLVAVLEPGIEAYDLQLLDDLAREVEAEVTFRELVGEGGRETKFRLQAMLSEIEARNPRARLVHQDDYNIYYMPDNTLRTRFLP